MSKISQNSTKFFLNFIAEILFRSKGINDINKLLKIQSSLTKYELLGLKIFDYTNKINNLNDDLGKVEIFIRRFPVRKYYEENNIDQLKYIQYHYEVFIHKIHTILEVKKLIINQFYEVGLNEKECNWNELRKDIKVKKSPLKDIIENYFDEFRHLIDERHLNTHRAIFEDKTNSDLSMRNFFYLREKYQNEPLSTDFKEIIPKFILDFEISEYRKNILFYIKTTSKKSIEYSDSFQKVLFKEFEKNIK